MIVAKKQEDADGGLAIQTRSLERMLATKLTEFLGSDIYYSMRRIMAAEMEHIYKGPDTGMQEEELSTDSKDLEPSYHQMNIVY